MFYGDVFVLVLLWSCMLSLVLLLFFIFILTDYLLLLCRYSIDELSNYMDDWIEFLKRNITLIGGDALKALLIQANSMSSERDKRQLNDVSTLSYKVLITDRVRSTTGR